MIRSLDTGRRAKERRPLLHEKETPPPQGEGIGQSTSGQSTATPMLLDQRQSLFSSFGAIAPLSADGSSR